MPHSSPNTFILNPQLIQNAVNCYVNQTEADWVLLQESIGAEISSNENPKKHFINARKKVLDLFYKRLKQYPYYYNDRIAFKCKTCPTCNIERFPDDIKETPDTLDTCIGMHGFNSLFFTFLYFYSSCPLDFLIFPAVSCLVCSSCLACRVGTNMIIDKEK